MIALIGKYTRFVSTFNWKTPEPFNDVAQSVINFCWNSWMQKLSRKKVIKVSSHDIYDARTTLAAINYEVLKRFREESFSHPLTMSEKEWNSILDEIIWTFSIIKNDLTDDCSYERLKNGLELYSKYFLDFWS
jgi:hypothetical protein